MRWQFGVPPKGNANFAWVQHFIHHLVLQGSIHPGFNKFMELAMGSPKWRVARRESTRLPKQNVMESKQQ
jgi:hypothetical protein